MLTRFHFQATLAELTVTLEHEPRSHVEKIAEIEKARVQLSETFQALAAQSLRANNDSFLLLARQEFAQLKQSTEADVNRRAEAISGLLRPMRESLDKVDAKIGELEKSRASSFDSLHGHIKSLLDAQNTLRDETSLLSRALRNPNIRGRWGEMQLRRVVELAGMLNRCDFFEQETVSARDADNRLRPDLTVHLPGRKCIVIDAKAPLESYLLALDAKDDKTRSDYFEQHASSIRSHLVALARKSYSEQFDPSPEFVVLFLPGENFFPPLWSATLLSLSWA